MKIKKKKLRLWIFFALQWLFAAYSQAQDDQATNHKPLYQVSITENTARGRVLKVISKQKLLLFKSKPFAGRTRKYDAILVLDDEQKNVLAEAVIKNRSKDKRYLSAKIVRTAKNVKTSSLKGKTIVRMADVSQALSRSQTFSHNPLAHLGVGVFSRIVTAANVLSGAEVNPQVAGFKAAAEFFAPPITGGRWTNWLGLRFEAEKFTESTFQIKAARSEITQEAFLNAQSMRGELIFQPWFEDFLIERCELSFGLIGRATETLHLAANDLVNEPIDLKLTRQFTSYSLGISLKLMPNFRSGLKLTYVSASSTEVSDSSIADQTFSGTWTETHLLTYVQFLYPVSEKLQLGMLLELNRRSDQVSGFEGLAASSDYQVTEFSPALYLSLAYNH